MTTSTPPPTDPTTTLLPERELTALEQDLFTLSPVEFTADVMRALERDITAYKQVVGYALRLTNANDWTDIDGKPYLQATGCDKAAAPFQVSLLPNVQRERLARTDAKGEYYIWVYTGVFISRKLGRFITAQGKCSSRDAFFGRISHWEGEQDNRHKVTDFKAVEDVDEPDVMQAAMTNMRANGIKQLLGLGNLTWEQVQQAGITPEAVTQVRHDQKKAPDGGKVPGAISPAQARLVFVKAKQAGVSEQALKAHLEVEGLAPHVDQIPFGKLNDLLKWLEMQKATT